MIFLYMVLIVIIAALLFMAYTIGPVILESLLDATENWQDVFERIRDMGDSDGQE